MGRRPGRRGGRRGLLVGLTATGASPQRAGLLGLHRWDLGAET